MLIEINCGNGNNTSAVSCTYDSILSTICVNGSAIPDDMQTISRIHKIDICSF
jgi:hypothetical protein